MRNLTTILFCEVFASAMFTLLSAQMINIIKVGASADISIRVAVPFPHTILDKTSLEAYIDDHMDIIEAHTWIPFHFDKDLFRKFRLSTLSGWKDMAIKGVAIQKNFCDVAYLKTIILFLFLIFL